MNEKHKPAPVAWARMKGGKIISVFHDKGVAEFSAGFAASELVPLYMHAEQPAPAVQGEPVAEVVWSDVEGRRGGFRQFGQHSSPRLPAGTKLYAHPQPAEQQPDVTLLLSLLSHARCNTCDGSGELYDNHGNPHQCQWCHDRSKAVAAYREGGES